MPFILLNFLVYAALASEMVKQIMIVLVGDRSVLSWRALIGVGLLLYPNFYSFWSFFNYINDRNWVSAWLSLGFVFRSYVLVIVGQSNFLWCV